MFATTWPSDMKLTSPAKVGMQALIPRIFQHKTVSQGPHVAWPMQ
jgi:hypothetical protein